MNRDETRKALEAQPIDAEVVVNVSGTYVELTGIRYDSDRQSIVVEVLPEDLTDALRRFVTIAPGDRGARNSL